MWRRNCNPDATRALSIPLQESHAVIHVMRYPLLFLWSFAFSAVKWFFPLAFLASWRFNCPWQIGPFFPEATHVPDHPDPDPDPQRSHRAPQHRPHGGQGPPQRGAFPPALQVPPVGGDRGMVPGGRCERDHGLVGAHGDLLRRSRLGRHHDRLPHQLAGNRRDQRPRRPDQAGADGRIDRDGDLPGRAPHRARHPSGSRPIPATAGPASSGITSPTGRTWPPSSPPRR